jgi:TP901 family phage tail tape measure protein
VAKDIRVKLYSNSTEFRNEMSSVAKQMKIVKSEFEATKTSVGVWGNELRQSEVNIQSLNKQMELQQQKVAQLKKAYEDSVLQKGLDSKETQNLAIQLNFANTQLNKMQNELTQTTQKMNQFKENQSTSEFQRDLGALSLAMRKIDSEFKVIATSSENFGDEIKQAGIEIQSFNQKMELQRQLVSRLEDEYNRLVEAKGQDSAETKQMSIRLDEAKASLNGMQNELTQTTQKLEKLQSELSQQGRSWGDFASKMDSVGSKMQSVGGSMAMTAGAGFATMTYAMQNAVGVGMDFGQQVSRVGAISEATGEQLKALKDQALDLGASTSKSATEIAQGQEALATLGFTAQEIIGAMPGVISAAEASGSDMAQTAEVMASTLNIFGMEASKANDVADILAKTANISAANLTDMQYALKYAGPPAAALGISLEELSAGIGIMTNAGMKGEQAGTTLRGALLGLLEPSKENSQLMSKMGITITDTEGNFVGLTKLIKNFQTSMEGMTDTQKAANIASLVGTEAVSGMLSLMEAGPTEIDKMTVALQNSAGASAEAAKKMKDNLAGAVDEMSGALETAKIKFTEALTPAIKGATVIITDLTEKWNSLDGSTQKTIATTVAVGTAILGVVAVGGILLSVVGSAVTGLGAIATGFGIAGGAAGVLSGALAVITGPIGLTVAGLAILGVAAYKVSKELKKPSLEAQLFGDGVSKSTQKAVSGFLKLNEKATESLNQLNWSGTTVTKATADNIVKNFEQMSDQMLAGMKKKHEQELATMNQFFSNSKLLSEKDKQDAIAKMNEKYEQQTNAVNNGENIIKEIMAKASNEKRSLTEAEKTQINLIQEGMVNNGIKYLSKNELESKSILERMKAQAGSISASQAADVVENSQKQTQGAIKAANEQYDKTVQEIIRQRDEVGSISAEQANIMILDAKMQRDSVVNHAEGMHKKVVSEAKKQAGEHADHVNWEKGEVLSKWEMMKKDTSKKVSEIKTAVSNKWEEIKEDTSEKWEEIKAWPGKKIDEMNTSLSKKMEEVRSNFEGKWQEAETFLKSVDLKQVGIDIISGLLGGLNFGAVKEKVEELANSIPDWMKKVLIIRSPSKKLEKEVGEHIPTGVAKGISNKASVVQQTAQQVAASAKKGFETEFKKIDYKLDAKKISAADAIKELEKLKTEYKTVPNAVERANKAIYEINKKHNKELEELRKQQFEREKTRIEQRKYFNQLSLTQELKLYEDYIKKYKVGSEERLFYEREVYRVKQELHKEQFDKEKELIEQKKYYNELSLTQELRMYENNLKKYKLGSEERMFYEREIYRVKQEINLKLIAINEEYTNKISEANNRLIEEEKRLTNEYNQTLDSRTKSLYSFSGIFDEVTKKSEVSGQQLIENLKSQVTTFEEWSKNIATLASKGIDKGLLEELRAMGPSAATEIAALNTLSDQQLQDYVNLWKSKNNLARTEAVNELQGLQTDTQTKITELRTQTQTDLELYKNEWIAKIKEIRKGTTTQFDMKTSLSAIGRDSIQGLIDGMKEMEEPLKRQAQALANTVPISIQKTLDIRSPSRRTKKLGVFVPAGLAEGIKENMGSVIDAAKQMALASIPDLPSMAFTIGGAANAIRDNKGTLTVTNIIQSPNLEDKLEKLLGLFEKFINISPQVSSPEGTKIEVKVYDNHFADGNEAGSKIETALRRLGL